MTVNSKLFIKKYFRSVITRIQYQFSCMLAYEKTDSSITRILSMIIRDINKSKILN
jgi:hypothetical protein